MSKVSSGFVAHFKRFFGRHNSIRGIVFGLFFCTLLVLPLHPAEAEPTLQEILDGLGYSINVATDETGIKLWPVAESLYMEVLLAEYTSLAPQTLSGWYKKHSPSDTTVIFVGSNEPGDTAYYYVTGTDSMGLFIDPISFAETYTETSICQDKADHAWVFLTGNPHEFIVAWEEPPRYHWDWDGDYQDRVILFRPPDQPPIVTVHADFETLLCEPDTICFDGISAFDPDYNDSAVLARIEGSGDFDPVTQTVCFLPSGNDSTYRFVFRATDIEGAIDEDTVEVMVDINEPPQIISPPSVTFDLPDTATICFDITLYDPDDSVADLWVSSPGEYDSQDTSICFLAKLDTTYDFTLIATDVCGTADTAYTTVEVNYSPGPVVTAPDNVEYDLCDTATVCFDITLYAPDDTLDVSVNPPGQFNPSDSSVCFFADRDTTYNFSIIASDTSGKADTAYTEARVNFNDSPVVTLPVDVDTFLCEPENLCFAVEAADVDPGDTIILEKIEGPGIFAPDTGVSPLSDPICFLPDGVDSTYRFIFRATDQCEAKQEDTFYVTVDLNEPPVVVVPADTSVFVGEAETLCLEIDFSDPDNSADVSVNPPWYYDSQNSSVCLVASEEVTSCCTVIVTDSCQVADTGIFCATLSFNGPPTVQVISPPSGDTLNYLPTLSIRLEDDLGLDRGYFQIDGCTGTWMELWSYNSSSTDTTIDWTVPGLSQGLHAIYFKVTDDAGLTNADTCSYSWSFVYRSAKVSIVPSFLSAQCGQDYILWIYLDENIGDLDSAFFRIAYEDSFMAVTNVLKGPDLSPPANFEVSRVIYSDSILISLTVLGGTFDGPGQILGLVLTPGSDKVLTEVSIEYSVLYDSQGREIAHQTAGAQIDISCPTSVEGQDEASIQLPSDYRLSQNFPNPYNLRTRIAYQLPQPGKASLRIYNIKGQLIRTLLDGYKPAGNHVAIWDGTNDHGNEVSSGIYFYRLEAGEFRDTRKMVLLK